MIPEPITEEFLDIIVSEEELHDKSGMEIIFQEYFVM